MWAGVSPVPAQMWTGLNPVQCEPQLVPARCGRARFVPAQMLPRHILYIGRPPRAGRGTSRPSRASRGTAWRSCPSSSRSAADTATSAPRPPVARICAATCLPDARDDEAVVRAAAHDHDRAVPARAASGPVPCRRARAAAQARHMRMRASRRRRRVSSHAPAAGGLLVQFAACAQAYRSRSVRLARAWMARTTTAAQRSAACSKHARIVRRLCSGAGRHGPGPYSRSRCVDATMSP